ncbi:MAG: ABC transporter permease subunit [Clostridia bacterium]|nr:ABC transporter permease subunit [Clostridia bacterium]
MRKRLLNVLIHVLLGLLCLLWLAPFALLVLQSFRGESGGQVAYAIPKMWTLENYRFLLTEDSGFLRWYGNTLIIALVCALTQTVLVLSVAYALSRLRFRGRRLLMNIALVLGMFPGFLTLIVLYYLLKLLGLTQSGAVPGLILIYTASSPLGYYIAKGFFDTIPRTLDEAARIDGANRFQVFRRIMLPLSKPIVIYTVLMAFMAPWGDYLFASYVAFGDPRGYNVAVGLYRWVNTTDYQGYFTRFCAGGVLVALPVTALFMALQRYYVEGVTGGAVKG